MNQPSGYAESNFGDKRLDKRFVKIYTEFQKTPKAIISHVIQDSHQCKAAYRFFNNPLVTPHKILESHHDELISFLSSNEIPCVLELQDTTECDYTSHSKTTGVGILGDKTSPRRGLECHTSLIVTTEGLSLGIGSISLWRRDIIKNNEQKNIRKIPIEEKESFKWINAIKTFNTDTLENLDRVIIADREADFYELFDYIFKSNKKMVIRQRFDRKTDDGIMIKNVVQNAPIVGYTKIKIKSKGGDVKICREEREVELAIRYSSFEICHPKNIDKTTIQNKKLPITVVHAKEINPPDNEESIEWYLLTNVKVSSLEDAIKILRWYSCRWLIEEFHKILKAGIKIEEARLSEGEELEKLITFLSVIALKILWMSRINRIDPSAPIDSIFDKQETEILMRYAQKKTKKQLNNVDDAIKYITGLGGFKGRKCDGYPGLLTLWRGIVRFYDIIEGALI